MRRMSISPVDEEQVISTNYRRRSSVMATSQTLRDLNSAPSKPAEPSRVAEFYAGRSVFVTGASGFVGKLLIEKLLRACDNLKRIFVLIRPRRNKSAAERFEELFSSTIFAGVRKARGGVEHFERFLRDKIQLLEGDLTEPLLGLSGEQLSLMADEVTVVLHSAAIVSFDGKLRRSIRTNLTGTRNVLEVACRLPRLSSFVHVSTCYSNCTRWHVDEHIYPVDIEPEQIIDLAECLDDEMVDLLRDQLIGHHPNPYTYTKQLAEYLVGQYGLDKRLPVLICRPSIVISTLEEPLVGFTDNRNGMNGIFWAMNRGLLRTAIGVGSSLADQVPADTVVNAIISLGWFAELYHRVGSSIELGQGLEMASEPLVVQMREFYKDRKASLSNKLVSDESLRPLKHKELIRIPVCNVSSGVENPISFHEMLDHVAAGGERYPSINLFRAPRCRFTSSWLLHKLKHFWFHTLVGLLLNWFSVGLISPSRRMSLSRLDARDPARATKIDWSREFNRIDRFMGVLSYFTSNTWYFKPETRQKLMRDFMNGEDNRLFNCDTSAIDWKHFGDKVAFGMRKYIMNEREETIKEARIKYRNTYWRNTSLQFILLAVTFHVVYLLIPF